MNEHLDKCALKIWFSHFKVREYKLLTLTQILTGLSFDPVAHILWTKRLARGHSGNRLIESCSFTFGRTHHVRL